jgi:hypothetical protein
MLGLLPSDRAAEVWRGAEQDFPLVADRAVTERLLLRATADRKEKPGMARAVPVS